MVKDEECQDVREEEGIRKDFHGNWSMPKPCDACRISSALLYCRADSAYLCLGCDVKVHGANKLASRHERVWMCEVCEQAPAVVTCKADAAALCVSCDADIHSANPLARRHERVPVIPFYECSTMVKAAHINVPSLFGGLDRNCDGLSNDDEDDDHLYAAEAASWLLTNPKHVSDAKNGPVEDAANPTTPFIDRLVNLNDRGVVCPRTTRDKCSSYKLDMQASGIDFFPEIDPYLDVEYASMEGAPTATDSVVPVKNQSAVAEHASAGSECLDADVSCKGGFSYTPTTSLSHSVSSSSLDVGVVPDGTLNDISTPYHMSPGVFEFPTPVAHGSFQYVAMDREARVLRYKEKRKNRKFEKTIRYASRKAYAETRPRIKGRFAKRTDADVEQIYASSLISDSGYGVVPSF